MWNRERLEYTEYIGEEQKDSLDSVKCNEFVPWTLHRAGSWGYQE